jgi:D-alanyl-D-alanine-carboxypeptidase/D-alanyl-D-alanine-endopeptidase
MIVFTPALFTAALALPIESDPPKIPWPSIEALADELLAAEAFPSLVIGVAIGDHLEYRTFGRLTTASAAPAPTLDTLYEIGSITKTFTGVLFADAVKRGDLSLETKLADVVPEGVAVPDEDDVPITLAMLANHSSALPRMPGNFMPRDATNPYADYDAMRLYDALALVSLNRTPGRTYEYSNYAIGLLGQILVDRARAQDFEALLREKILSPLALSNSFVALDESGLARLAPGHTADLEPASRWDFLALAPAGAIRSTIVDLLAWGRAQYALDPESPLAGAVELAQVPTFEDAEKKTKVALGWHVSPSGALWHTGQTGGYHGYLGVVKERKVAVAALANAGTGEVDKIADYALSLCIGKQQPAPQVWRPIEVKESDLDALVGEFRLQGPVIFTIEVEKEGAKRPKGLWARLSGQPWARVYPESPTRFRYRIVDAALTFELEDGKAKTLILHQFGKDQRCERISP